MKATLRLIGAAIVCTGTPVIAVVTVVFLAIGMTGCNEMKPVPGAPEVMTSHGSAVSTNPDGSRTVIVQNGEVAHTVIHLPALPVTTAEAKP